MALRIDSRSLSFDLTRRVCLLISDHCSALAFSSEIATHYPERIREIKSVGITSRALNIGPSFAQSPEELNNLWYVMCEGKRNLLRSYLGLTISVPRTCSPVFVSHHASFGSLLWWHTRKFPRAGCHIACRRGAISCQHLSNLEKGFGSPWCLGKWAHFSLHVMHNLIMCHCISRRSQGKGPDGGLMR